MGQQRALVQMSSDATREVLSIHTAAIVDVVSRYQPLLAACHQMLRQTLTGEPEGEMLLPLLEHGKLIRPLLLFLAADVAGGDLQAVVPGAAALELCHAASLIHDDIIDAATVRRGLPAVHVTVGEGPAIVLGDYLIFKALSLLSTLSHQASSSRASAALDVLLRQGVSCCRGQYQELVRTNPYGSDEEVIAIMRGKTSSLFVAALEIGAVFGDADDQLLELMRIVGDAMGLAFQVQDDILDITGETAELGKPARNSLDMKRPMLPVAFLNMGRIGAECAAASDEAIASYAGPIGALNNTEWADALRKTKVFQAQQVDRATRALHALVPSAARDGLLCVLSYCVTRTV